MGTFQKVFIFKCLFFFNWEVTSQACSLCHNDITMRFEIMCFGLLIFDLLFLRETFGTHAISELFSCMDVFIILIHLV